MTTRVMQNVGASCPIADEFARRVGSVRDSDFERAWISSDDPAVLKL